jgi:hypothetical protein
MGCTGSKPKVEESVPAPVKPQPSQQTSIPGGTTSTPPPGPGTTKGARGRAQSQGTALSQRRHDNGRDYLPPSSGGDVFISKFPDRQEMPSRQYPSGGAVPMQRNRSMSMDVTALKGAPSHSSVRRDRTTSTAVQGSGHQRVGTKSMSAATSQTPAGRQGGRSRFPFALQSLLPNDFRYAVRPSSLRYYYNSTIVHRFRILVVGKVSIVYHTGRRVNIHISSQRECGKSSLIRAIFKADMSVCTLSPLCFCLTDLCALQNYKRSPINVSGRTAEFRPPDNRHLIVHECSASGTGEMQAIRDFITTRNHKSRPDSESLHAIW